MSASIHDAPEDMSYYTRVLNGLAPEPWPEHPCDYFDGERNCRNSIVPGMEWCPQHGIEICAWVRNNYATETRPEYMATPEEWAELEKDTQAYEKARQSDGA
jgi:hypothetical protein